MKKIIASAVGLMLVGGVAATSVVAAESQFGGYWRTRFTFDDNLRGVDATGGNDTGSNYQTDTRTRLYYTAKFSDNFKFVNKFEFDAKWGGPAAGYGDIGADGKDFEIKNSYIDYTMGMINTKLGVQGARIARGFLFDDDFSGAVVTADFDTVKLPVVYATSFDEEVNNSSAGDGHLVSVMPSIKISDALTLTPHVTYATVTQDNVDFDETDLYYVGADIDLKLDAVSAWGTFIYNGGDVDDADVSAFLLAAGATAGVVHGQAFYASGDDDAVDTDRDDFQSPLGSSYYWSEIMGLGIFDDGASNGSPNDNISNIWAANVGVTLKPVDKLTVDLDVWYAQLAEENAAGDDELGIELDAKLTYALEDNLNVDFVFAYLIADDATGDEDVIESGVRVSLAF